MIAVVELFAVTLPTLAPDFLPALRAFVHARNAVISLRRGHTRARKSVGRLERHEPNEPTYLLRLDRCSTRPGNIRRYSGVPFQDSAIHIAPVGLFASPGEGNCFGVSDFHVSV